MATADDSNDQEERLANRQAWRNQGLLRPAVHLRKIREYGLAEIIRTVHTLPTDSVLFEPAPLGVTEEALRIIGERGIAPHLVFCTQELLRREPKLLGYYRRLSGSSIKAVKNVLGDPEKYELGLRNELSEERATGFVEFFNAAISRLIETFPDITEAEIEQMVWVGCGTQIQGSWAVFIGEEAKRTINRAVIEYLSEGGHLTSLVLRDGSRIAPDIDPESYDEVRTAVLRNGITVTFSSDPDIAIRLPNNMLLAVHEIKGGIDRAAALERSPAAGRSHRAARDPTIGGNPACRTVLVTGVVTHGMLAAIRREGLIEQVYSLSRMLEGEREGLQQYLEAEFRPYALRLEHNQ